MPINSCNHAGCITEAVIVEGGRSSCVQHQDYVFGDVQRTNPEPAPPQATTTVGETFPHACSISNCGRRFATYKGLMMHRRRSH